MKYYAYKDTGKPAPSSDVELSDSNLNEVPDPAVNQYQIWDGAQWTGSELTLEERYGQFRVAMLSSAGWQRIKVVIGNAIPEFMGAIAYMNDNPGMVKYLWNMIISDLSVEYRPTAQEVAQWRDIVSEIEIGIDWIGERGDAFDFTTGGLMI